MVDDAKIHFYLTHRQLIEEWAALGEQAAEALDRALLAAAHELLDHPGEELPLPRIKPGGKTLINLDVTGDPLPGVSIELGWERKRLLRHGPDTWPSLRLVTNPNHGPALRDVLKAASLAAPGRHGMDRTSNTWWVRYGDLAPDQEPIDIEDFARACVQRFVDAYLDMRDPIHETVVNLARSMARADRSG